MNKSRLWWLSWYSCVLSLVIYAIYHESHPWIVLPYFLFFLAHSIHSDEYIWALVFVLLIVLNTPQWLPIFS